MRGRRTRVRRAFTAVAAVACVLAGPAGTAGAVELTGPPGPEIETLLAATGGDGGPATLALVNAKEIARDAAGDLLFRDIDRWRRVDADGTVARDDTSVPGLPPEFKRNSGGPASVWPGDYGVTYVMTSWEEVWVVRVDRAGTGREIFRAAKNGDEGPRVLAVSAEGSVLVSWDWIESQKAESTQLVGPDGTTVRTLAPYAAKVGALAGDGSAFLVPQYNSYTEGGRIERVVPGADGGEPSSVTVAGPGATSHVGDRPDGVAAVEAHLRPTALAVSPDGSRVAYADAPAGYGTAPLVRAFSVGGAVRTIAGGPGTPVCLTAVTSMLAEDDGVLVGCGGIRRYAYDGSQAPRSGTVVAGLNAEAGWADSPSGTPLAHAFLGHVLDVAENPATGRIAMATRRGVYTVDGDGPEARLVRLAAGETPAREPITAGGEPTEEDRTYPLDIAFGPDGTLFRLSRGGQYETSQKWRVESIGPGGVRTVAGGGTAKRADGVLATDADLGAGRITVGNDGTRLYVSQPSSVWEVDLGTGRLRLVAGGTWGDFYAAARTTSGPSARRFPRRDGWGSTAPRVSS